MGHQNKETIKKQQVKRFDWLFLKLHHHKERVEVNNESYAEVGNFMRKYVSKNVQEITDMSSEREEDAQTVKPTIKR